MITVLNSVATTLQDVWLRVEVNNTLNSVATTLQDVWLRVDENNSIKQCGYIITRCVVESR